MSTLTKWLTPIGIVTLLVAINGTASSILAADEPRSEPAAGSSASNSTTTSSDAAVAFKPRPAAELRRAINEALRATNTSKTPDERDRAIRQLMVVFLELEQDQNINHDDRVALHSQIRSRLMTLEATLRSEMARQAKPSTGNANANQAPPKVRADSNAPQAAAQRGAIVNFPAAAPDTPAAQNLAVLAQLIMLPGQRGAVAPGIGAAAGPAGPPGVANSVIGQSQSFDYGPDLVDLIHAVVAPRTWDFNGGPGSVVYFRNFRVLVVSAPAEVHSQVGDLLGQLRK